MNVVDMEESAAAEAEAMMDGGPDFELAFNFAHLLSAAYGGAPCRLGRLRRRPRARCAHLFLEGCEPKKCPFCLCPPPGVYSFCLGRTACRGR